MPRPLSDKMTDVNYFNDVPEVSTPDTTGTIGGSPYLDNLISLQVGSGTKLMRADQSGLWLGATKFVDAPFSVDMSGHIIATSGAIAGWDITATTLLKNNATLDSAGKISLGTGNDIAILTAVDSTYRLWIGNATAGSATFTVTKGGYCQLREQLFQEPSRQRREQ